VFLVPPGAAFSTPDP